MREETFFEVLGDIREEHVQEARAERGARRSGWMRWGAVAACLCVLLAVSLLAPPAPHVVTASGSLTITAHAAPLDGGLTVQEGVGFPLDEDWSPFMSSLPGLPLRLTDAGHPDATFEVSAEGGTLLLWSGDEITYPGSPYIAGNGSTVYWASRSQSRESGPGTRPAGDAYIDIVIREEANIIGYAVIQIYTEDAGDGLQNYYAKLLESVSFPLVDGKYQRITSGYVASELERIKGRAAGDRAGQP